MTTLLKTRVCGTTLRDTFHLGAVTTQVPCLPAPPAPWRGVSPPRGPPGPPSHGARQQSSRAWFPWGPEDAFPQCCAQHPVIVQAWGVLPWQRARESSGVGEASVGSREGQLLPKHTATSLTLGQASPRLLGTHPASCPPSTGPSPLHLVWAAQATVTMRKVIR